MRRLAVAVVLSVTATGCNGADGTASSSSRPTTTAPPATTAPPSTAPTTAPNPPAEEPDTPGSMGALVTARGIVVPILGGEDSGWEVRTPCGDTATVTEGTRVTKAAVVLDAGHGGNEPGAVSPDGLAEKGVNLGVARATEEALRREGVSVLMTRTGDYPVSLATRAEIAKAVGARAFVSVHHNAVPDEPRPQPGSETYYQIGSSDSKRLSGLIYEEVFATLAQYENVEWVGDRDAGAKYRPGSRGDYYAVLRLPGDITSVLVELAFISNRSEARLLADPDVQRAEGEAVARGILRYLNSGDPGSGFVEPYPRDDPPGSGAPPPCRDPEL